MSHLDNTQRFSDRVDNYVRFRPHYPAAIIPFLQKAIGLASHWVMADIGCGTGISSELFVGHGNKVLGVEPNGPMRQAAVDHFKHLVNFTAVDGTAEATTLPNGTIDLIIAAQAFHWFDLPVTKAEFKRIGKPNAFTILIRNERLADTPFMQQYAELLQNYATDHSSLNSHDKFLDRAKALFEPATFQIENFANEQTLSFEDLKGRLLSSSYAPLPSHPRYDAMVTDLKHLFDTHQQNGKIPFGYRCQICYGQLKG